MSGAGLSNLTTLILDDNLVSSLSDEILDISLSQGQFHTNCLVRSSLSPALVAWLDTYASDDWEVRSASCAAAPSTMYFFGTFPDSTDWDQQANWYTDALHTTPSTLKSRPDAADNVIILTDVFENTGIAATVKTLEVRDDAVISIPITNNASLSSLTTALAGDNNDITWTALDPAVTITYAEPVEQVTTTVTVSGKDITVTPGSKA